MPKGVLYLLLISLAVFADDPPKDPILRFETGMHTNSIFRIGVDASEKYLVTGSLDKTVRVWELANGKLVRTLRPPIADGDEGGIIGVAITPDGRTIACGGHTGNWDSDYSIYIFDRDTGDLVHRITRIPDGIANLAYSPDGRLLVAALGGGNGVRLFRVPSYKPLWSDDDYDDLVWFTQFATRGPKGTLLLGAASWDGSVRLYSIDTTRDEPVALLAKTEPFEGGKPGWLSFSPDGSRMAVSDLNSADIRVLSSDGLKEVSKMDMDGVGDQPEAIESIAWSSDGRFLYGGGKHVYQEGKGGLQMSVFRWDIAGKNKPAEFLAGRQTITDVIALKRGGFVYATAQPSFGAQDKNGKRILYKEQVAIDYRSHRDQLLVSGDGSRIQFLDKWFSLTDRMRGEGMPPWKDLQAPITTSAAIQVTDWVDSSTPKRNGTSLLIGDETSRSLAVSPDGDAFVLGTDQNLRLYDKAGAARWVTDTSRKNVWAINISRNQKLVIAAVEDGTIHWSRFSDGQELLAFYPHPDGKRWVLCTPSGYYDISPGAEELIGWHMNNGPDAAADFFPADRYRSKYYRPDIITKLLTTLDEDKAVTLADAERKQAPLKMPITSSPPVIRVVFPADGASISSNKIAVKYMIRTPSGEAVTRIRVLINGKPVEVPRSLQKTVASDLQEIDLNVPRQDCEITLLAEDRLTVSEPATVRLKWSAGKGK